MTTLTVYLTNCASKILVDIVFPILNVLNDEFRKKSKMKVSKGAKIRNRYNQVPHLTQDTNEKVTNSQ